MRSGSGGSLASLPSVFPGFIYAPCLWRQLLDHMGWPGRGRPRSVTALGTKVLVAPEEGIQSSVLLVCSRPAVPACAPSRSLRTAALAPTAPRGRILAGSLRCFYCFIISPVRKREGCSFGCNLLTCQLLGSAALIASSKLPRSLPFSTASLACVPRALNPRHPSLLGPQFHQQHCSGTPRERVGKSSVNSHARYSHPLSCCLWPWSRSSGENAPLPDTQKHSIHLQAPVVGLNRLFLDCGWLCQIHNRPPPWLWGLQQVLRASVTSVRNEQAWLFSCTGRKGHFFRSKSLQKLWEICFKDWHYTNTSVFKKAENSRRVGFLL